MAMEEGIVAAASSLISNASDGSSSSSRFSIIGVTLIFLIPALGGLLFGYDIGATSYVILQLASPFALSGVAWWSIVESSAILQGCIVSFASLGALIGSCAMFTLADQLGRRRELRIGAVFYLMGCTLEVVSGSGVIRYWQASSSSWGLLILLAGRLVYGIGIGISMHAAPTYLAEMGPSTIRGLLVALKEAAIVFGMLIGYSVGYHNSSIPGGWVYTYATSAFFSLTMLGLSLTIPRSSRWLLKHGLEDEALESLRFVFVGQDADREFSSMKELHQAAMNSSVVEGVEQSTLSILQTLRLLWKEPSYRAPLVTGVGLVVLQQVTGQPSVLSYAAPIFANAGLSIASSILVAAFKLAATLVAAFTVEKFGRKKLLYTGCSLMLVALICLTVSFIDMENTKVVETLIFISMFVYIGGYQVGFGPITWLITSEVFPLEVRGHAVSLAVSTNFLLNAIVQFGVPVLEHVLGLGLTFAIFAALDVYSLYFVKIHVPETKGLTLEQIEQQFAALSRVETSSELEPLLQGV